MTKLYCFLLNCDSASNETFSQSIDLEETTKTKFLAIITVTDCLGPNFINEIEVSD